jgi:AcrR family transcriptional regulator
MDMPSWPGADALPGTRTNRIVEAAFALLEDEGFTGLTIRAVLARTGFARRAFYESFASKDDLVLAVFAHTIRLSAAYYAQEVASIADPIERLRVVITSLALGTRSVESFDEHGSGGHGVAMSREHIRLAESRPAELHSVLGPLIALLTRLLADGMAAGAIRKVPPARLARLIYNLVSTTIHAELLASDDARPNRAHRIALAEDVWDFCRRAIMA